MRASFVPLILVVCLVAAVTATATPGDTLRSILLPSGYTQGLVYDGKYLWSADRRTDMLYKFNPTDGKVVDSISSPGYYVTGLTFDGKWLWCVDAEAGQLFAVDPATRLVRRTLSGPVNRPGGLAWDGKYLWLVDQGARKLHQIDPNDGTTIVSLPAPSGDCGALSFDGHYLWAGDRMRNEIYMVTPDNGDVIIVFKAPAEYISGLACDGKNLWAADYQTDRCYQMVINDGIPFSQSGKRDVNMEFTHQLRNYGPDSVTSLEVYLAVPHDLPTQKLLTKVEFQPQPAQITKDKWGQEIAQFEFKNIGPDKTTDVSMRVGVELYKVRYFVFPEKVGQLTDIPAAIRDQYLVDDIKFSYKNPVILSAVKEAVGDETNPYWIARRIFRYVIEHMSYELSGGWNLAPTVLERGNGSCSEYTFVYIAMCRAAGLPARYAGAITHRGDDASWDDVHHRWVEIYLPNYGWIPVDPSGGDSATPVDQANAFGFVDNRFLITTLGGGGSEYLDWTYNANERWISRGKCKIVVESFGEWTPRAAQK